MKYDSVKAWFLLCTSFYVSIILMCAFNYTVNILNDSLLIEFRYERLITIVSLGYFFILLLISLKSNKTFWLILPFIVLTVPNAVNSIFPGFYLTHLGERGNASFSFISHIDIYLLSNILINLFKGNFKYGKIENGFKLIFFLCAFLALGLLYKSLEITLNDGDYIYILNGAFHFRYLFLILLLSSQLKSCINEKAFVNGLMLAIPLLAFEALVSSSLSGVNLLGELKSGNFANNVFGNFLAFLFIYFFIIRQRLNLNTYFLHATQVLLFVLVIMTGVRGAMLSLFLGLLAFIFFIRVSPFKIITYFLTFVFSSIALIIFFDYLWVYEYILELFRSFQMVIESGYGYQGIKVDENNSSLITRVAIWKGTLLMAMDNWLFGVGASQWNYLKEIYGVPFKVLLDPHNDYLNFFCLFGLPGLMFLYILYIKPIFYVFISKETLSINPYQLALFTLSISSLTNANNSKHQVFAIVVIFAVLSIWGEKKQQIHN